MKVFLIGSFLTGFILLKAHTGNCQFDSSQVNETSKLEASLFYSSNIVFMGRADSMTVPYISPGIKYTDKSGFFIGAGPSYLPADNRVDLISVYAGYDYLKNSFGTGISLAKLFYNESSYNVQSEIPAYVNTYAGINFYRGFHAFIDLLVTLSSSPDFFLGTELSYVFYAAGDKFQFRPGVFANAGTLNYYNDYYNYRRSGTGRGRNGTGTRTEIIFFEQNSKFRILDYELKFPMNLEVGKFGFSVEPVIAFPVNPISYTYNQQVIKEELETEFFWAAGIRYRF